MTDQASSSRESSYIFFLTLFFDSREGVDVAKQNLGFLEFRSWYKGDPVPPKGLVSRTTNGWSHRSDEYFDLDLMSRLSTFLDGILVGLEAYRSVRDHASFLDGLLSVGMCLDSKDTVPALYFEPELLRQILKLEIALDIDIIT